jgi:hypothetical protein
VVSKLRRRPYEASPSIASATTAATSRPTAGD